MGKRSEFVRVEKDFYRTIDKRAVEALAPFLTPNTKYAEPCYGDGDLEFDLEKLEHECVWRSDIEPTWANVKYKDALELDSNDLSMADCVITNPPWTRTILHPMIEHLSNLKPTWLLFDSDWAFTKQSAALMKIRCTDIVAVGRLIWIPGTTMQGKDNCSWYRFDINKVGETRFHGRSI